MNRGDIVPGRDYAYRPSFRQHTPLERVRAIELVRGRRKVEWIDPNPGLTDYVRAVNLIVPWPGAKAFLKEESRMDALVARCDDEWPGNEHPVSTAVDTVLDTTGEAIAVDNHGVTTADDGVIERVAARARVELPVAPPAFTDRFKRDHFPFRRRGSTRGVVRSR